MEPPVIEVKNLRKAYGSKVAVENMSFSVLAGETFGLLGPNGAGKSTTISILTTLLSFDEGDVAIGGLDLRHDRSRIKHLIGLVPQDLAIYPGLSARDNLAFFGKIYGLKGSALSRRVDEVLRLVELADRAADRAETFSGGMKRRLNIGAGLMHRPRILFLDEPTVGVDPQSRNFIFEHIERLSDEGMTVIYTTHYMEEAERLCDRVAIVDAGRVVAMDTVPRLVGLLGDGVIYLTVAAEHRERTGAALRFLEGMKVAVTADGRIEIETARLNDGLVEIAARCKEEEVPILSLELLRPNLEAVFLHLTGKRLRD